MNLMCRLPHLFGQTMLVEGREYFINDLGICSDVFEEHGNLLLEQQDTWCLVHPEDLTRPAEFSQQRNDRQPEGVTHLILPPGTDLDVPHNAVIETDPEKIQGRTDFRKKGRRHK
jgi:hypothetical protein